MVVRAIGAVIVNAEDEVLSLATRLVVAGSKTDIWIGGKLLNDLAFLGSVEDRVYQME